MVRLIIVIAIAIAGLIIFIAPWDPPRPPRPEEEASDEETIEISVTGTETETVSVSINAIPWARVFIKLPQGGDFIEPRVQDFTIPPESNVENSNVTPIRGRLKVPIGTTIKLVYQEKEKIFPYETWKYERTISHDFLNE